jgi:flagellar biosynthesis chaperone FliJ
MENSEKLDQSPDEYRKLKEQCEALQKQVADLQSERDAYLQRVAVALAKKYVTEEVVEGWMAEEKVEGSLLHFIEEAKSER